MAFGPGFNDREVYLESTQNNTSESMGPRYLFFGSGHDPIFGTNGQGKYASPIKCTLEETHMDGKQLGW